MDFWDALYGRRSIRDFLSDPVEHDKIEKLIAAAGAAPSAMNMQPWRYHIAQGESRAQLGTLVSQATVHLTEYMDVLGPERYQVAVEWYSSLGNAPVVIGVSSETVESEFDRINVLLSVGASIQNLLLAATAEGLATCNVTFAWWVRDELAELFSVGDDREVVALVALGYPTPLPPVAPDRREDIADWLE
jgi:nitroreductase